MERDAAVGNFPDHIALDAESPWCRIFSKNGEVSGYWEGLLGQAVLRWEGGLQLQMVIVWQWRGFDEERVKGTGRSLLGDRAMIGEGHGRQLCFTVCLWLLRRHLRVL